MANFVGDGQIELYFNNSLKFETESTGVKVTGNAEVTGNIELPTVNTWIKGNGSNSVLQVDATRTYFYGGSDGIQIRKADNSAHIITVDDSGNTTVNGTGTNTVEINGTGGHELYSYHDASGVGWATGSGGSFGELVYLNEANSNVVIYTAGKTSAKFLGDGAVQLFFDGDKKIETATDKINFHAHAKVNATNTYDLGASGARWATIYSQNALNTSDKNLKNTIQISDLGLSFINKLNPVSYKFNSIEGQRQDNKTHYGLIAQEVEEVLTTENKTIENFAVVVEEEGVYNLAYNELVAPLIKALQELSAKVNALEAK